MSSPKRKRDVPVLFWVSADDVAGHVKSKFCS